MSKTIARRGVVTTVRPGILQVKIDDETACDACSTQKSCCLSKAREKQIDVPFSAGNYDPGDEVTVIGKNSMGLRATFIAFVLPLILMLAALAIASAMALSEQHAALISLSTLIPYYLGLYLFRNRFKQTFTFTVQ
jgi:sigma-E factor negative regulatory protein RseC